MEVEDGLDDLLVLLRKLQRRELHLELLQLIRELLNAGQIVLQYPQDAQEGAQLVDILLLVVVVAEVALAVMVQEDFQVVEHLRHETHAIRFPETV